MKIKKRHFVLRLITLPIKLTFQIAWQICFAIWLSWKWLLHGGEFIIYVKEEQRESVRHLVQVTEELLSDIRNVKK